MSCRKVYEFLSTFIVTGMRFLVSQQVGIERGWGTEVTWGPPGPAAGGAAPREDAVGPRSPATPGALAPPPWFPSPQPRPFQICPSLEHASLVLLNSLLDTVPGERCSAGRGRAEHSPVGCPAGFAVTEPLPGSEELRG